MVGARGLVDLETRRQVDMNPNRVGQRPARFIDEGIGEGTGERTGSGIRSRPGKRHCFLGANPRQGKAQAPVAGVRGKGLLVRDLHCHLATGLDVGHRGGEKIGPLPFHQARPLALGSSFHVSGLGLFLLLNLALKGAACRDHPHVIHRGISGQGEDVYPLDPFAAGVLETLAHADPGDGSADADLDLGAKEGPGNHGVLVGRTKQHPAAAGAPGEVIDLSLLPGQPGGRIHRGGPGARRSLGANGPGPHEGRWPGLGGGGGGTGRGTGRSTGGSRGTGRARAQDRGALGRRSGWRPGRSLELCRTGCGARLAAAQPERGDGDGDGERDQEKEKAQCSRGVYGIQGWNLQGG